jgi:hypothetical protein
MRLLGNLPPVYEEFVFAAMLGGTVLPLPEFDLGRPRPAGNEFDLDVAFPRQHGRSV